MSIEFEDPTEYQHQPDPLRVARQKVKKLFSKQVANLIQEVTEPVDNLASQGIFIDPILRKSQSKDKTPREIGK